jgi:hypothetical protein
MLTSPRPRQLLILFIVVSMASYLQTGNNMAKTAQATIAPFILTGDFAWNPPNLLAGGNISFTPSVSGGSPPYKYGWNFGDAKTGTSNSTFNSGTVSHVYMVKGNYTVTLKINDTTLAMITVTHTINVRGTPVSFYGWSVNWDISPHHGVEIYNVTHSGITTIRDGILAGILVRYKDIPPPPYLLNFCLFYDQLDFDDLNTTVAGFSLQFSSAGPDPYFQIRANYNPAQIGYNYTEIWRFYQSGRFDAELAVSHLGCARDHIYEPHWRLALTVGNPSRDLMSQYTSGGVWQNLVWEGNYTDNGARDPANNQAQWRIGDGTSYYYMTPSSSVWASDLPYIPPKIYLVRDRPAEVEATVDPSNPNIDPIIYANGELAYRQQIAFWFLPDYWDHWLGLGRTFSYPGSEVTLSFSPYNI